MTEWTLREKPLMDWTRIWDALGFQINEGSDGRFLLLDANMPHSFPGSSVLGKFGSFESAAQEAKSLGPQDWSEWKE